MKKFLLSLLAIVTLVVSAVADDGSTVSSPIASVNFNNFTLGPLQSSSTDLDAHWVTAATYLGEIKTDAGDTTQKNLWLDADDHALSYYIEPNPNGTPISVPIENGIFFDSSLRFTAGESRPTLLEGDKILLWMKVSDDYASTNFVVTAGEVAPTGVQPVDYEISNTETVSAVEGEWFKVKIHATYEPMPDYSGFSATYFTVEINDTFVAEEGGAIRKFLSLAPIGGGEQGNLVSASFEGVGAIQEFQFARPATADFYQFAVKVDGLGSYGGNAYGFTYVIGGGTPQPISLTAGTAIVKINYSDSVTDASRITFSAKVVEGCEIEGWEPDLNNKDDEGFITWTKTYSSLTDVGPELSIKVIEAEDSSGGEGDPEVPSFELTGPDIYGLESDEIAAEDLSISCTYTYNDVTSTTEFASNLWIPVGTPSVGFTITALPKQTVGVLVGVGNSENPASQDKTGEDLTYTYTVDTSSERIYKADASFSVYFDIQLGQEPEEPPVDNTPGIDGETTQAAAQAKVDEATSDTGITLTGDVTASDEILSKNTDGSTTITVGDIKVTVPVYYDVKVNTDEGANGFKLELNQSALSLSSVSVTDRTFTVRQSQPYEKLWYRLARATSPATEGEDNAWTLQESWTSGKAAAELSWDRDENDAYRFYKVEVTDDKEGK